MKTPRQRAQDFKRRLDAFASHFLFGVLIVLGLNACAFEAQAQSPDFPPPSSGRIRPFFITNEVGPRTREGDEGLFDVPGLCSTVTVSSPDNPMLILIQMAVHEVPPEGVISHVPDRNGRGAAPYFRELQHVYGFRLFIDKAQVAWYISVSAAQPSWEADRVHAGVGKEIILMHVASHLTRGPHTIKVKVDLPSHPQWKLRFGSTQLHPIELPRGTLDQMRTDFESNKRQTAQDTKNTTDSIANANESITTLKAAVDGLRLQLQQLAAELQALRDKQASTTPQSGGRRPAGITLRPQTGTRRNDGKR